jgi:multidrug efflux pump subunit AcrA (membrane-fusion protein)
MTNPLLTLIASLLILNSCGNNTQRENAVSGKLQPVEIKNPVKILILESSVFQKELISNGKLNARYKSILRFNTAEELAELHFRNGDCVKAGEAIAGLRTDKLKQAVTQAELSLAKAKLDLRDILPGQQYQLEDSSRIPVNILDIAKLRSGYSTAIANLENARWNHANAVLTAPFSGMVANIKHKVYEQVSPSEEFCTLIDNSAFEIEFSLLETEIGDISLNKSYPFNGYHRDQKRNERDS